MKVELNRLFPIFCIFCISGLSGLVGCTPDLKKIEKELKNDKTRKGKVGTLRALETIQKATELSKQPCAPLFSENFEGILSSTLEIRQLSASDKELRYLEEQRILRISSLGVHVHSKKKTRDELGIKHTSTRDWFFDGQKSIIQSGVGHGKIAGLRPPSVNERAKVIFAGVGTYITFRGLFDSKCSHESSVNLKKELKNINFRTHLLGEQADLVWSAESQGRVVKIKYSHILEEKKMDIKMPEVSKTKVSSSGFESAEGILKNLKKENLILRKEEGRHE